MLGGHADEVFIGEAPADIDASADHACVTAGGIDEDAIEACGGEWGAGLHAIVAEGFGDGGAEAGDIFAESGDATFVEIAGDDFALIFHQLGEVSGSSAGGGAGIEDAFAWLGVEEIASEEGAGILDVAEAFGDPVGGEMFDFDGEGVEVGGGSIWGRFEEVFGGDAELIGAEMDFGGLIIPGAEFGGGGGAEGFCPAIEEELGVRHGHGGRGGVEGGEEGIFFAESASEDGIDEASGVGGEVDGFVDGGVGGGPHVKDLVETEAEEGEGLGIGGAVAELSDDEI